MASTADWVTPAEIFMLRHADNIDWSTGRPIWIYHTHDSTGRRVEKRYRVTVTLEEII